ncbi:unnamed protein product [Pleuronectes platessa]|uniref:O-acetyl-ADP-ribose deacetylase MACROD2 n=1 Tax=Pleuronectes platessa TaxID=8262 RepID=A0A9N7U3G4_PLEPL|nr:unnamed protein product [Pleuronectes platessa]
MSKKKKDWKTERERLLRLDQEERRKEYRRQDFISLDKIPSWREENTADDKDEGKEPTGGGGLSDKVSLYKGDITGLELDAIVNAGWAGGAQTVTWVRALRERNRRGRGDNQCSAGLEGRMAISWEGGVGCSIHPQQMV